ncbi:MAG: response regulator [Terracidiphilus sp.]|jgi:two-component system OmpR family response regulator
MSKTARILVVDDDELIALTLTAILQEQGYEVAAAFNGKQAIALAAEFFPDLLLSDVHIGAMNGVQAAIRITAKLPHCRVLFLSGHASTGDLLKDVPKRMECSFISKPPNLLDLLNAIAYMLPAESTAHDDAEIVVDHATLVSYAIAMTPGTTGFMLEEDETRIGIPGGAQGIEALFDMTLLNTASREMQLQ